MSLKGAGYIVGAYEHPTRKASDKSVTLLHAECAKGALEDAGLTKDDIDGYYCAGDAPGLGPLSMVDYMNLKCPSPANAGVGIMGCEFPPTPRSETVHRDRRGMASASPTDPYTRRAPTGGNELAKGATA